MIVNKHLTKGYQNTKLWALYEGDLENIKNVFGKNFISDVEWYKFVFDPSVISNLVPVQSNIVKKIIDTINNVLYSKVDFISENDKVKNFVTNLETSLQLSGVVAVRWCLVEGIYKPKIFVENLFDYAEDEFEIYEKQFFYHYDYEKDKYRLTATIDGQLETNILEIFDEQRDRWVQVPLTEIIETAEIPETFMHPFETAFIIHYNNPLSNAVSLVELMDEALSFMAQATVLSMPTTYTPVDLAIDSGSDKSIDEQNNPYNLRVARMCGFLKVPYLDKDYQKVEIEQAIVQVENYEKVKDTALREILAIIGISPSTFGLDNASANSSGSSITAREQLTERFRDNLLNSRIPMLEEMFATVGVDVEIKVNPYSNDIDDSLKTFYLEMYSSGAISKTHLLRLIFPHYTNVELEELKQEERLASFGI